MGFNEDKVYIVRLVSGEELLALVETVGEGIEKVHNIEAPFFVSLNPGPSGAPQVHLQPFLFMLDEEDETKPLQLPDKIVAFKYRPAKDIRSKYNEIYVKATTGLILPSTNLKI